MFEDMWCEQAKRTLKLAHPDWDEEVMDEKLHTIFNMKVKDKSCMLTNNYKNTSVRTSLLTIISILLKGNMILGGDGCIYVQHDTDLSLLYIWIQRLLKERKQLKRLRDQNDKGTVLWLKYDLAQNNKKVMINSLYGILGYMRFHLFNVNIAQSVTSMGQAIISTATCHFENYIADSIKFVNTTELIIYINNVIDDFNRDYEANKALFKNVPPVTAKQVADRLYRKLGFNMTAEEAMFVSTMIVNVDPECLKLLYYKNNMQEFLNVPYIRALNNELMNSITCLRIGDIGTFDHMGEEGNATVASEDTKSILHEFMRYLDVFVLYTHQIFDRVRRARYTPKHAVLYIDTDSNFISVQMYVTYTRGLDDLRIDSEEEFVFKSVNIFAMVLTKSIADVYKDFGASLNVRPEYAKLLGMKNEFYYSILLLGKDCKKRYIGRMLIQEGKLIKGIDKQRLIAGFDFKKAGTKDAVRAKFYDIIDRNILLSNEINLREILKEVRSYEKEVEVRLREGDSSFYRQLTVQNAARYAAPLSNQGYKATFLWNAFNPLEELQYPAEVDIIPITLDTGMSDKKYLLLREIGPEAFFNDKASAKAIPLREFYRKHHDIFMNYYNNILRSPNESTWKLTLNCIAKPIDMETLPEWLADIINVNKITSSIIQLINPVIEPLGTVSHAITSTTTHYTNVVDI